jgi:hypothetical protein
MVQPCYTTDSIVLTFDVGAASGQLAMPRVMGVHVPFEKMPLRLLAPELLAEPGPAESASDTNPDVSLTGLRPAFYTYFRVLLENVVRCTLQESALGGIQTSQESSSFDIGGAIAGVVAFGVA